MAEWRRRKYVPDSDEEEEESNSLHTPSRPHENSYGANQGFLDVDELLDEGKAKDTRRCLILEVKDDTKINDNVEDGANVQAAKSLDDHNHKIKSSFQPVPNTQVGWDSFMKADDIDELQQDHFPTPAKAQLAKEAPKTPRGKRILSVETSTNSDVSPKNIIQSSLSSISSSPLTPLPPTPPTTFFVEVPRVKPKSQISRPLQAVASSVHKNSQGNVGRNDSPKGISTESEDYTLPRLSGRTFRQRNPIQLHPYALESEQYRQSLKARGLKPLRIIQEQVEESRPKDVDLDMQEYVAEEDSQSVRGMEDSQNRFSSPPHHADSTSNSQVRQALDLERDDFPDMDTLLRQPTIGTVHQGFKRRKTAHTYSRGKQTLCKQSSASMHIPTVTPQQNTSSLSDNAESLFDIPPSPPPTRGSSSPITSIQTAINFRYPPTIPINRVPTPEKLLEPRSQLALEANPDAKSKTGLIQVESESEGSFTASHSENDEAAAHELQRVQRKLRGVLPASWLKLDLKAQAKGLTKDGDPRPYEREISPPSTATQRGVARPVASKARKNDRTNTLSYPIEISDDDGDESPTDHEKSRLTPKPIAANSFRTFLGNENSQFDSLMDSMDIPEDDRIDPMLPSVQRLSKSSRKPKIRQTRLTDNASLTKVTKDWNPSRRHQRNSTRTSEHIQKHARLKHRKSRFRAPQLGILDATLQDESDNSVPPPIIRVASRTARLRLDAGRHSPSRKCIQLATKQDTLDTQEALSWWRSGSIALKRPKAHASALSRKPLTITTGNEQRVLRSPGIPIELDRSSRKSTHEGNREMIPSSNTKRPKSIDKIFRPLLEKRLAVFENGNNVSRTTKKSKPNRAHLLFSLHEPSTGRPALLESNTEMSAPSSSKARSNHVLETHVLEGLADGEFILDKFLDCQDPDPLMPVETCLNKSSHPHSETVVSMPQVQRRQNRKRPPRYLNTRTASFKQSGRLITNSQEIIDVENDNEPIATQDAVLQGLGQFGTQYTTSFEITPLPTGTFISKDTFIGSGTFAKSLAPTTRNLDLELQRKVFSLSDESFQWGPWTDTVSSQLGSVNEHLIRTMRDLYRPDTSTSCSVLKTRELKFLQESIIEYLTENISFLDPIDRNSCLQRCISLAMSLKNELEELALEPAPGRLNLPNIDAEKLTIAVFTRCLVQLNCLGRLADSEVVPSSIKTDLRCLLLSMIRQTVQITLCNGLSDIFSFLESCSNIETLHWNDHHKIESIVILYHIAKSDIDLMTVFQEAIINCITASLSLDYPNARLLDRAWKDLFGLLPLFEFNDKGVLISDQRHKDSCEMWSLVKRLIDPALKAYVLNAKGQNVTYNVYIRALFGRCFHLINEWGWSRCETIIGVLFDFFARNSLAHLQHEESRGSAPFLEHLAENLTIHLSRQDLCFHILLKIIGTGLRAMREVHLPKKIRDIVWRLMPNHGRNHPKDESLRQEDLDALRNHYDLLSVLYWASPANARPRLTAIRNLVSLESSHREACQTSIRAWSSLARYQVSTSEPLSALKEFTDWHSDILSQVLKQHQLARTEVEAQARLAESLGRDSFSCDVREQAIARNQRQVEVILSDALVSLQSVIRTSSDLNAAKILFTTSLSAVIDLLDVQHPRTNVIILQYLDIVSEFCRQFQNQATNDDSQGYGDWSAFEEESGDTSEKTAQYLRESLLDPMSRLLSNCFGSDVAVDDVLLQILVETWVLTLKVAVGQGIKSWNDYLGPYGQDSWSSLRDTEQRRKFTALFLTLLIQDDAKVYQEHRVIFDTFWMESLVERESLLKFQNVLTESILSRASENPLLTNLPFGSDTDGKFHISMPDFRQRRLSLISCILSNMRESLDFSVYHNLNTKTNCKREYIELLKAMMSAMKRNYHELGSGTSIRGSYVEFAQRIIGFLQQHTADFYPIDRFFTDSTAFPLPTTDPTYVVDRLRNYKLRLQDSRTPKQLSMFMQSVSERAAVDNQQIYLAEQLTTAMSKEREKGDRTKLTLRSFLILVVFPAYIELSFSTSCGWLLATPVLQSIKKTFSTLIEDLDGTSQASVDSVGRMITTLLDTIRKSSDLLIDHPGLFEQPTILKTLSMCFSAITTLLPILSYIARLPFPLPPAVHTIRYLKSFANFAVSSLSSDDDFPESPTEFDERYAESLDDAHVSIRAFVTSQLKEILQRNWVCHDGRYYNDRSSLRREVAVHIGSFEDERGKFISQAREFAEHLARFPALNDDDDGDDDSW